MFLSLAGVVQRYRKEFIAEKRIWILPGSGYYAIRENPDPDPDPTSEKKKKQWSTLEKKYGSGLDQKEITHNFLYHKVFKR